MNRLLTNPDIAFRALHLVAVIQLIELPVAYVNEQSSALRCEVVLEHEKQWACGALNWFVESLFGVWTCFSMEY